MSTKRRKIQIYVEALYQEAERILEADRNFTDAYLAMPPEVYDPDFIDGLRGMEISEQIIYREMREIHRKAEFEFCITILNLMKTLGLSFRDDSMRRAIKQRWLWDASHRRHRKIRRREEGGHV